MFFPTPLRILSFGRDVFTQLQRLLFRTYLLFIISFKGKFTRHCWPIASLGQVLCRESPCQCVFRKYSTREKSRLWIFTMYVNSIISYHFYAIILRCVYPHDLAVCPCEEFCSRITAGRPRAQVQLPFYPPSLHNRAYRAKHCDFLKISGYLHPSLFANVWFGPFDEPAASLHFYTPWHL